jgi:hypothetical protein
MDSDTRSIRDWLRQHQICEVECLVPDITGNARGKFIPINQFLSGGEPRLPESIMIQSVTGEYSAEHWDFVEPTDADMILKPDASAVRIVPWAREPTAQIIHDCYTMDGKAHPLATRNVLRKVLKLYEDEGLKPVVAPEEEFYLVRFDIIADSEVLSGARRLAWVDVINSADWILVCVVLEIEVRLQLRGNLSNQIMNVTKFAKFALYGVLFAAAAYWGYAGSFLDFWDAALWLFAFIFIELNVFEWQQETSQEPAAAHV